MSRETIKVATGAPYPVHVGPGVLAEAAQAAPARAIVLSDGNVSPLHGSRLRGLEGAPRHLIEPGEGSKSFAGLEELLDFLVAADLDRGSAVVALGGGVVGDLGGLAASLYMRGIGVVQCPTTLLAQVDASVGGKTAVNLAGGKNLAGTFHQPLAVFCDVETLATLPDREVLSGLGEVVKTALIGDGDLLRLLEEHPDDIRAGDPELLAEVVARCVRVKAGVVSRDERESGERKKLNLGHTFGHAIEHAAGFGAIPHGVAVAAGLGLALQASARLGLLAAPELPDRLAHLHARLGLPPDLATLRTAGPGLTPADLLAGLRHDKKGRAGEPALVLIRDIGDVVVDARAEGPLLTELLG